MRTSILACLLLLFTLTAAGCYSRPAVPHDKPLACASPEECPEKLKCVSGRCVPATCVTTDPAACPAGFVCAPPPLGIGNAACVARPDAAADPPAGEGGSDGLPGDSEAEGGGAG